MSSGNLRKIPDSRALYQPLDIDAEMHSQILDIGRCRDLTAILEFPNRAALPSKRNIDIEACTVLDSP